eukprot:12204203-Alexandrium_andersonii.AAC.1
MTGPAGRLRLVGLSWPGSFDDPGRPSGARGPASLPAAGSLAHEVSKRRTSRKRSRGHRAPRMRARLSSLAHRVMGR